MLGVSRIWEKVSTMAEGGSHYCSKKTDDICEEVSFFLFIFFFSIFIEFKCIDSFKFLGFYL